MNIKHLLITLTIFICTSVQSSSRYPDLTNNYDSVWRANIDHLRKDFTLIDDDPFSMYLKDTNKLYNTSTEKAIDFVDINKPVPDGFVKASDHLDAAVINKFSPKSDLDVTIYILKNRLEKIKDKGSLLCEYKMKLADDYGDQYYYNLKGLKDPYIKFMISKGYETDAFIDNSNMLGITKLRNGYDSGSIRVLIKGRVLSLSVFDCQKDKGKAQIINDLTEWAELLIKANK